MGLGAPVVLLSARRVFNILHTIIRDGMHEERDRDEFEASLLLSREEAYEEVGRMRRHNISVLREVGEIG